MDLDLRNFSCKILTLCDELNDMSVHFCYIFPYSFKGHMRYMTEILINIIIAGLNTKADNV
jgi:hypothetical protein